MSRDLEIFFDTQKIDKSIIIGHSMGGKMGMYFTLRNSGMVEKLVVVDIAPRYYPTHHDYIIDALCDLDIHKFERREEVDKALSEKIDNRTVRQFLLKNLDRKENGQLKWKINLPVIKKNLDRVGEEIKYEKPSLVPSFFIAGKNSHYVKSSDKKDVPVSGFKNFLA